MFQPAAKLFLWLANDSFCVIHHGDIAPFLKHLNSFQRMIKFAVEEVNGCVAFLNVEINHTASSLSTSVHRKPTHTGKYLNFVSSHPIVQKQSVALTLFSQAFRLCSTAVTRKLGLKSEERLSRQWPSSAVCNDRRKACC